MEGEREIEESQDRKSGTSRETTWIRRKSEMLDEVNQLVNMMSSEKLSLQKKIDSLESELDQYHRETSELQRYVRRKDKDCSRLRLEHSALQDKCAERKSLQEALQATRTELSSVHLQLETLNHTLQEERECHSRTKKKLSLLDRQYSDLFQAFNQQSKENTKLRSQVDSSCKKTNSHHPSEFATVKSQLDMSRQRQQKLREETLALRGRLAISQKAYDRLQAHCSALEKTVSSRTQLPARASRRCEEIRLAKECRKKDELLTSYLQEISTCHEERKILQEEIVKLKKSLMKENEEKSLLKSKIEACTYKNQQLQQHLEENVLSGESGAGSLHSSLGERLEEMSCELVRSQKELQSVREEVQQRETIGSQGIGERDTVQFLQQQLETAKREHMNSLESMNCQWQNRLQQTQEDCDRLKEASMGRCVELAREVWELRSKLNPDHDQ